MQMIIGTIVKEGSVKEKNMKMQKIVENGLKTAFECISLLVSRAFAHITG